eukprot:195170-Chlamydomonas_euryale.AAC.1
MSGASTFRTFCCTHSVSHTHTPVDRVRRCNPGRLPEQAGLVHLGASHRRRRPKQRQGRCCSQGTAARRAVRAGHAAATRPGGGRGF